MARALVITCGLTTLDVEHGSSRECPFTLRSQADGELRVQLRIFALDATAQGWLAIPSADTIELSPGETRQVSVRVNPQASGRFAFRLDAIPVAAGERTIGPSVDLVVAGRRALAAPRRGLPWLLLAALLLALLLLAFGIAWILDLRTAFSRLAYATSPPGGPVVLRARLFLLPPPLLPPLLPPPPLSPPPPSQSVASWDSRTSAANPGAPVADQAAAAAPVAPITQAQPAARTRPAAGSALAMASSDRSSRAADPGAPTLSLRPSPRSHPCLMN